MCRSTNRSDTCRNEFLNQEDTFGADSDDGSDEELQPAKKRSIGGDDEQARKRMRVAVDDDEYKIYST